MGHIFGFDGQHFGWQPMLDADKGGAGGGAGGADNKGGAGGSDDKGGGKGGVTEPFATFPDEKSFMSRISREAKGMTDKQLADMAKEMGFESVDAMKAAAKAAKDAEDAKKGEAEKEKEARLKAEAKAQERESKASNALLAAAVTREATALGIVDPEAALKLMDRSGVKVDLDATTVEGVKEALEALLKKSPYLKGTQAKVPDKGGADMKDKGAQQQGSGLRAALAKHLGTAQ
jgi:hypothetical protein